MGAERLSDHGSPRIRITGRYPEDLFSELTVGLRWVARTTLCAYWLTDRHPPFVWA
jgi:hypothetical protein